MQNKWNTANEADFVNLNARGCGCAEGWCADGAWLCGRCGCTNRGCNGCVRCGCQGGIVATEERRTSCEAAERACACQCGRNRQESCACEAAQARQADCETCPPDRVTGHSVQCCPANTTLRAVASAANAGCSCAAAQEACCGCAAAAQEARCGCAVAAQEARCGCAAAAQEARCGCAAAANANGRAAECPEAAGVGMVYAVSQDLGDVYQSESALRTGTLFPELHKPMNGRCPGSCNCSSTGQQSAFAAWDMRLYLDTHPDDRQALNLFAQLAREAEDPNYATAFLTGGTEWTWTGEPWPWECRPCNAQ